MALLKADMCLAVIEMTSTKLNHFRFLHLGGLYLSLGIYLSLLCDRFIYLLSSLFLKVNKLVYLGQEKLGGNFTRICLSSTSSPGRFSLPLGGLSYVTSSYIYSWMHKHKKDLSSFLLSFCLSFFHSFFLSFFLFFFLFLFLLFF